MPRSFTVFFWLAAIPVALMSWRFLLAPVAEVMPNMAHYLPDAPLATYAHLIAGPLALLLAPFQLWRGLRARFPALHRWMGRTYGLSILIAGAGTLAMLPHFTGHSFALVGFAVLAVLWVAFTVLGIVRARAGDLAAHRRWMLRSVALTFAAVTLRIIMPFLMMAGWSLEETYLVTAWASWLINLAVLEVWQNRRALGLVRPRRKRENLGA